MRMRPRVAPWPRSAESRRVGDRGEHGEVKALLVGYGKMGKAIEAALVARGHTIVDRIDRREPLSEGDTESASGAAGAGLAASERGRDVRRAPFLESESGSRSTATGAHRAVSERERDARRAPLSEGELGPGHGEAGLAPAAHAVVPEIHSSKKGLSSDPPSCDVAFEFTTPSAAPDLVSDLLSLRIPVVSGTTGWDVAPAVRLAREQNIPFLHSPNFSIAVAALRRAVTGVAELLAAFPEFEPGILERHHSAKKDAPSGTARLLAAAVAGARPGTAPVPIVSLRQGGQPGEHVVFFEGANESVELVHRARSRALFAAGAVHAAEWILSSGRRGSITFDEFLDAARSSP